jgi:hypothetical protein
MPFQQDRPHETYKPTENIRSSLRDYLRRIRAKSYGRAESCYQPGNFYYHHDRFEPSDHYLEPGYYYQHFDFVHA